MMVVWEEKRDMEGREGGREEGKGREGEGGGGKEKGGGHLSLISLFLSQTKGRLSSVS